VLAAIAAAVVAGVQLRHGIVRIFDSASYWSAARATAHGHPGTTNLAPTFSTKSVIDFLAHDGRLPFVYFPLGYPLVAGLIGAVVGVKPAMIAVTVASAGALGALTVAGAGPTKSRGTLVLRGVVGAGLVGLSIYRLTVQGAMSEPLFCALTVGSVAAALRARRTGRGDTTSAVLVGMAGLVRFVGAGLVVLPAVDAWRRTGWRRALLLAAIGVGPALANAAWGSVAGGHEPGAHGLHAEDIRVFMRSVAGWFEARNGNIALTFFGGVGWPPVWVWVVALVWVVAVGIAVVVFLTGGKGRMPEPLTLCLTGAGILTVALFAGMLGFDALVWPDNRLMLPAGVLTIVGIAWSADLSGRSTRALVGASAVVVLWIAVAVRPDQVLVRYTNTEAVPYFAVARSLDERIVISNDADGVHWESGKPSAYLPAAKDSLTGAEVDKTALYDSLPCALDQADAAVLYVDDAFIEGDAKSELDRLVGAGSLTAEPSEGATIYRPSATACS
jgi:hypothetical protein